MANKINFITGETYTLAELFSGERRIIIPDLQRDYCWGDDTNQKSSGEVGELVSDFVKNLIEQYEFKEQGALNLGLFYGYEIPADHIQLCDGQQRLTTLFLLLGMLNKKCGKFRHHLISDFEYKHDDKEPYLNYAIRETSLYFLSDLVCQFFIPNKDRKDKIKVDEIKDKEDWYFADYNLDPSIQSMLNALSTIESLLLSKDADWTAAFGDWVLNKLTFLYFDMENRKNGEETFVVINTTGESLSVTQNLKPLVIQEKNESFNNTLFQAEQPNGEIFAIDSCWEQIETWFWQKRQGDNDTADAGFTEFLRWVYMIEQHKVKLPKEEQTSDKKYLIQNLLQGKGKIEFPYKEIAFHKVYKYWKALVWLYEQCDELKQNLRKTYLSPTTNKSVNKRKAIDQNDCFVLLPVLKYIQERINFNAPSDAEKRNCIRIYKFFSNLIRIDNVRKAVNTLVGETLKIIDFMANGDIVSILDIPNVSKQILTEEEKCKLKIFRNAPNRDDVENEFWKLQTHSIWNGEILPMIQMAQDDNKRFDFNRFKNYSKTFYELFSGKMEHERKARLLRCCMIVAIDSYKPISRGWYSTFAWEWSDWYTFISKNINGIRTMFDYMLDNDYRKPEEVLEEYISLYVDKTKDFSEFAVDDFLLNFTRNSKACDMIWDLKDWQICTTGGTGRHTSFFSRRNAYILKTYGATWKNNSSDKKETLDNPEWGVWYWCNSYKSNCVVFEHNKVKLDVRFLSEKNDCEIVLKSLDKDNITTLAKNLNFEMKKDSITESVFTYHIESFDVSMIKEKVDSIMNNITEFYHRS